MTIQTFNWTHPDTDEEYEIEYEHDFLTPGGLYNYKQDEANIERYGFMGIRWSWEDFITRYLDRQDEIPTELPCPNVLKVMLSQMASDHDCNYGISWDKLDYYLDSLSNDELLPVVANKLVNGSSKNS